MKDIKSTDNAIVLLTRLLACTCLLPQVARADIGDLIDASNILFQQEFTSYEDYQEKYGDPWADKALLTLLAYNDGLGYLLQKRLIDREIVENLSEGMITTTWEKLQPLITGMRKHYPGLHSSFEYLYKELKKSEPSVPF